MPSSHGPGADGQALSRRRLLAALGTGATVSLAGCSAMNRRTTVSGSWQTRGYGPARTGAPADVSGPEPPLKRRWKADFVGDWNQSSPVVAGDTVYLGSMTGGMSGREAETYLNAFDASTGEGRWTRSIEQHTPKHNSSYADSLTASDDGLFIQTFRGLRALDFDGTERWKFENTGPRFLADTCHPAITDGVVYTGTYGSTRVRDDDDEYSGSEGLFALDASDGSLLWEYRPDEYATDLTFSPTVADGTVYLCFLGRGIVALDTADGEVQWTRAVPVDTPATVRNGTAYVATQVFHERDDAYEYRLYALDAETGETVWDRPVGGAWSSRGISHDGSALYLSSDRYLLSLDAETGEVRWRAFGDASDWHSEIGWFDDDHAPISGWGVPVVIDDVVYAGDGEYGTLVALDSETGELLDAAPKRRWGASGTEGSPAVADGVAFYMTPHFLHAVDTNVFEFW